jgi:hypothetical protein
VDYTSTRIFFFEYVMNHILHVILLYVLYIYMYNKSYLRNLHNPQFKAHATHVPWPCASEVPLELLLLSAGVQLRTGHEGIMAQRMQVVSWANPQRP